MPDAEYDTLPDAEVQTGGHRKASYLEPVSTLRKASYLEPVSMLGTAGAGDYGAYAGYAEVNMMPQAEAAYMEPGMQSRHQQSEFPGFPDGIDL
jgi:hypothetical protein